MSKGQSNDLWMTKTPAHTCPPAHGFPQAICLPECTHLFYPLWPLGRNALFLKKMVSNRKSLTITGKSIWLTVCSVTHSEDRGVCL